MGTGRRGKWSVQGEKQDSDILWWVRKPEGLVHTQNSAVASGVPGVFCRTAENVSHTQNCGNGGPVWNSDRYCKPHMRSPSGKNRHVMCLLFSGSPTLWTGKPTVAWVYAGLLC